MSYRPKFFSYTFSQRAVFLLSVILTSFCFCSIVVPHCEHIPIVVGTKPTFINRILVLKNLQSEHEHIEERRGKEGLLILLLHRKKFNAGTWSLWSTKTFNHCWNQLIDSRSTVTLCKSIKREDSKVGYTLPYKKNWEKNKNNIN